MTETDQIDSLAAELPCFPGLRPAARPALPGDARGDDAFRRLAEHSAQRIGETAEAFLETDEPEAAHQLRVALRRYRSLLKLFRPQLAPDFVAAQTEAARGLAARLGPLRELDVMARETLPALAQQIEGEIAEGEIREGEIIQGAAPKRAGDKTAAGLRRLAKSLKTKAQRERAAQKRGDLGVQTALLLIRLQGALGAGVWRRGAAAPEEARGRRGDKVLSKPADRVARAALDKAAAKLADWGRRIETLSIEERHEMRKKAKVLRYAVEFFGSLYDPATVKPYRKALKKMQESFGALNDAADLEKLRALEVASALKPAIEAAIARAEELMEAEFETATARWRRLEATPVFWR